ncbi:MAG: hypothetical protein Q8862_07795 [Bacteroidota bacterium]|nr:hypothetical protein [Bacteroidota bacterium]
MRLYKSEEKTPEGKVSYSETPDKQKGNAISQPHSNGTDYPFIFALNDSDGTLVLCHNIGRQITAMLQSTIMIQYASFEDLYPSDFYLYIYFILLPSEQIMINSINFANNDNQVFPYQV